LLCQEDLELELVVLDRLLEGMTKKGRQLFQKNKCTLRQNPGYTYGSNCAHWFPMIEKYTKPLFRNSSYIPGINS